MPIRYDIPDTCHILPYHIRKRKKQYDCQRDCDEIFDDICAQFQIFTSTPNTALHRSGCNRLGMQQLTNKFIEQPGGSHIPNWYNMFLGMDFSFLPRRANVFCIQHRSHEKCKLFSTLAKLQAFNVNVNHPAFVKQHFVRHAKVKVLDSFYVDIQC